MAERFPETDCVGVGVSLTALTGLAETRRYHATAT